MCGSMVNIQSATAEIRRGKKKKEEERRKIETTRQKCNGGHNNKYSSIFSCRIVLTALTVICCFKLATRQLLGAREYSPSYHISYHIILCYFVLSTLGCCSIF